MTGAEDRERDARRSFPHAADADDDGRVGSRDFATKREIKRD